MEGIRSSEGGSSASGMAGVGSTAVGAGDAASSGTGVAVEANSGARVGMTTGRVALEVMRDASGTMVGVIMGTLGVAPPSPAVGAPSVGAAKRATPGAATPTPTGCVCTRTR